jgi:hypothetical protein
VAILARKSTALLSCSAARKSQRYRGFCFTTQSGWMVRDPIRSTGAARRAERHRERKTRGIPNRHPEPTQVAAHPCPTIEKEDQHGRLRALIGCRRYCTHATGMERALDFEVWSQYSGVWSCSQIFPAPGPSVTMIGLRGIKALLLARPGRAPPHIWCHRVQPRTGVLMRRIAGCLGSSGSEPEPPKAADRLSARGPLNWRCLFV